jgi:Excalibur calcium-binding domain
MRGFLFLLVAAVAVVLATPASSATDRRAAPTVGATIPLLYKNCTNLNKRYPHGLGRRLAVDKTSGVPVRNFYRSTRLYLRAMSYNRGLDRDRDGIACEKR